MASKGQKFRKWSKEEKLRIVKLHLLEHQSLRQIEGSEKASVSECGYGACPISEYRGKQLECG